MVYYEQRLNFNKFAYDIKYNDFENVIENGWIISFISIAVGILQRLL